MAGSSCSSDVERLFLGLATFLPLRINLKPTTLKRLATLHYWYEEEEGLGESNDARTIGNARGPDNFAQLAIGRNTLTPVNGVGCCDEDSA